MDTAKSGRATGLFVMTLTGTAVMSITDPLGRTIRFEPDSGRYIGWSPYILADHNFSIGDLEDSTASTPPVDSIEIPEAVDGDYRIEVIGQGEGDFGLCMTAFDADWGANGWEGSGPTTAGSRMVYIARFTSEPGVGIEVRKVAPDLELVVTVTGPVVLSITDPMGRYVRYDSEIHEYVSSIPFVLAERNPIQGLAGSGVQIPEAMEGEYKVEVIGQGEGSYGMSVNALDSERHVTGWDGGGETTRGGRIIYVISCSLGPGRCVQVEEMESDGLQHQ